MRMTTKEWQFWNAVRCLNLEVEPSIARDLPALATAALDAGRAEARQEGAEAEREACARLAAVEAARHQGLRGTHAAMYHAAGRIERAIRARGA